MAYPHSFHRLVLGGTLYTNERWNTSIAMIGSNLPDVSDSMLEAVAGAVGAWFPLTGASGIGFPTACKLTEIKLNRIGTDGKYRDPVSQTHVYPTPIAGGSGHSPAPQLSAVVTLRTDVDRGLANSGRMFLVAPSGFDSGNTDGRALVASAQRVATAVSTLINSLRTVYVAQYGPGPDTGGAGVTSNVREGAERFVRSVEVGRVIDTLRSRRASLLEDRQPSGTAIVVPSSLP